MNKKYIFNVVLLSLILNITNFTSLFANTNDTTGYAQKIKILEKKYTNNPDSVLSILNFMLEDIKADDASNLLCNAYILQGNIYNFKENFSKEALSSFHKAIRTAIIINDTSLYTKAILGKASIYSQEGKFDSGTYYNNTAITLGKKLKDTAILNMAYHNKASIYIKKGSYDSAIYYLYKTEAYYIKHKNHAQLCNIYNAIAIAYQHVGRIDDAKRYYHLAIKNNGLASEVDNTHILLSNLGQLYFKQSKFDSAIIFFNKSLKVIDPVKNMKSYNIVLLNMGNAYTEKKMYKKALYIYNQVYHSPFFNTNNLIKTAITINLGNLYSLTKNYDQARKYTIKGAQLAHQNQLLAFEKNAYSILFNIDSAQGNWLDAIKNLQIKHNLKDSIINKQTLSNIEDLNLNNNLVKEKARSELLEAENKLKSKTINTRNNYIYILIGLIVFFIVLTFFIISNRKKIQKLHSKLRIKNKEIRKKNKDLTIYSKKLEESNKTKNKFFSIISHDLRSPFNSLVGITDVLENDYTELDEEEKLSLISALSKASKHAYDLLENLLEWSHVQNKKIENKPSIIDINLISKKSCALYQLNASQKNIEIINNIPSNCNAYSDNNLTQNTLNNLINNAIKFTSEGGKIVLSAETKDNYVNICITDTGVGIPEDKIDCLFNIGNKYKQKGTNREKGTGLGLVLCKEYVLLMGGTISVSSTIGEGSSFCIQLPLNK